MFQGRQWRQLRRQRRLGRTSAAVAPACWSPALKLRGSSPCPAGISCHGSTVLLSLVNSATPCIGTASWVDRDGRWRVIEVPNRPKDRGSSASETASRHSGPDGDLESRRKRNFPTGQNTVRRPVMTTVE